jgi:hypothetical protein
MPNRPDHERIEAQTAQPAAAIPANANGWLNGALLVAGVSGLWIGRGVAASSNDPAGGVVVLSAGLLVLASLAVLGLAIRRLVSAAESRWLHVFCGRRVFACGVLVLTIAALFVASIIRGDPFQQLTASGRITAGEIVDAGFVLAAVVCVTGAGMAFLAAWDAYRHERAWPLSLGVAGQ